MLTGVNFEGSKGANAYINARPVALHSIEDLLDSSFVRKVSERLPFGPVVSVRLPLDKVSAHRRRRAQLGVNGTIRLLC